MSEILMCLSFALLIGLLMSRVAKKVSLPAVTAYLVAGLLIGPFVLGRLNIASFGFSSLEEVEKYKIVTQTALGFIAFAIGNEFRLHDLKSMGKQAIIVGIFQAIITTLIVDVALISLHFINPELISMPAAIVLGAIAAATAPAATLMVVRQYKAEGPLTKLLLMVVAIDDAVGLIVFSISYGIAGALEIGTINTISVIVEPLLEIVMSFVVGTIAGILLTKLEMLFHSRSKRIALAVSFVMFTVGFSMQKFEVFGVEIGFSLLLVCMMLGTIFCNTSDASEELMGRVERWTSPLNILFFILSGAELDLNVLSNKTVLLIGLIFIVTRSFGKIFGSYVTCKATKCNSQIQKHLGITLLPQAGVALGMAITASNLGDGSIIRNVVLFAVMIYELVGPALTKRSLTLAGEIKPEGRKSSREKNSGNKKVHSLA